MEEEVEGEENPKKEAKKEEFNGNILRNKREPNIFK